MDTERNEREKIGQKHLPLSFVLLCFFSGGEGEEFFFVKKKKKEHDSVIKEEEGEGGDVGDNEDTRTSEII